MLIVNNFELLHEITFLCYKKLTMPLNNSKDIEQHTNRCYKNQIYVVINGVQQNLTSLFMMSEILMAVHPLDVVAKVTVNTTKITVQ